MPPEEFTSDRELPPLQQSPRPRRTGTAMLAPEGPPDDLEAGATPPPLEHAHTLPPGMDGVAPPASSAARTTGEDPLAGTVIAERYHLLERVGEGGMGAVYRGEHISLRKRVAVKFLHPELSRIPDVVARFEREAIAAANLEHRNVVAAHDFGKTAEGQFFLVMEFVEGGSLRELLDAEKRLAPVRAVHIARHIAAALHRAHAIGIVHRDLKPENVALVEREGDPDFAKVLDFGIAKVSAGKLGGGPALTQAGMVFGTPDYMAPEQALGGKVDHRADVYAFGVMVFEMLVGQRPFMGEDVMVVLGQHMTAPPPTASLTAPPGVLPPSVDAVLARVLAKSPGDRYQSASEFVQALEAAFGLVPSALGTAPPGMLAAMGTTPPYGTAAPVPASITGAQPLASHAGATGPHAPAPPLAVSPSVPSPLTTLVHGYQQLRQHPKRRTLLGAGLGACALLALLIGVASRPRPTPAPPTHRPTPSVPPSLRITEPPRAAAAPPVAAPIVPPSPPPELPTSPAAAVPDPAEAPPGTGLPAPLAAQLAEYRARPNVQVLLAAARGRQLRAVIAAFEQSRAEAPSDPIIAYVLGTLYARDRGRTALALERYGDALGAQPGFAGDPTLLRDVVRAYVDARRPPPQAEQLLTGPLAATAGGYLLEAALSARKPAPRARALALLAQPTFTRAYDDTARALVELYRARTCEEKRPVIERLGRIGDARALPHLRRIPNARGCGFLGLQVCNACLEDALPTAIRAIEARSH